MIKYYNDIPLVSVGSGNGYLENILCKKFTNQILEFTKEIKNYDKNFRLKIIKILWHIIYSDGVSDIYESNLMRRLSALLYITDKENGNIKLEVANNFK